MKKYLLLFILLLIPFSVNAETTRYNLNSSKQFVFPFVDLKTNRSSKLYYYANSFTYENGMYTLVNASKEYNPSSPYSYKCINGDETTCESIFLVLNPGNPNQYPYLPSIKLENGDNGENYLTYQVADSYIKQGDKYVLVNPTPEPVAEIVVLDNRKIRNKYFCGNGTDTCDDIMYIDFSFSYGLQVKRISDDFIYGNGFEYKNGKYILKDIVKSQWPNFSNYFRSYTCLSHSDTCDKLYFVINYVPDAFSEDTLEPDYYDLNVIDSDNKSISLKTTDTYSINKYIKDDSYIWIEDKTILKVENKTIIPLKKGTTNVLIQNASDVVLFKVNITDLNKDNSNISNPNTGNYIIVSIILVLSSLLIVTIYRLKRTNNSSLFN